MAKAKYKTEVKYVMTKAAEGKNLEIGHVYFKNVPVTYAQVHKVVDNYNKDGKEYQLTAFIDEESLEVCEDLPINKVFAEVDKTKVKKGTNRGNIKFSTEKEEYKDFGGMHGVSLSLSEYTKKGKKNVLKVLDAKGQPTKDLIGNGSICTLKCFAYRNADGELVVSLNTVVVIDLVEYTETSSGGGYDEELGFEIPATDFSDPELEGDEAGGDDLTFDADELDDY